MRVWHKAAIGGSLVTVLGLADMSIAVRSTRAQPPGSVEVKEPVATKGVDPMAAAAQGLEPQASSANEELELLGLQVETTRAQLRLAESRLAQAKRWESRFRDLVGHGRAPSEQLFAAQDSVLTKESDVAAERAELKAAELRFAQAQRATSTSLPQASPQDRRIADLERRLAVMERAVRSLRHESERIGLDLPLKASSGR
jgi:hypothetical protein